MSVYREGPIKPLVIKGGNPFPPKDGSFVENGSLRPTPEVKVNDQRLRFPDGSQGANVAPQTTVVKGNPQNPFRLNN